MKVNFISKLLLQAEPYLLKGDKAVIVALSPRHESEFYPVTGRAIPVKSYGDGPIVPGGRVHPG